MNVICDFIICGKIKRIKQTDLVFENIRQFTNISTQRDFHILVS